MAEVNHSSLTDPNLHEPKGIASATARQVYLSDGSGGGSWVDWPTGWGRYHDNATAQTFNTTAAALSINGSGANTDTGHLPTTIRGVSQFWDTSADVVNAIELDDVYLLSLDLPVTASATITELTVQLDVGGGSSPSSVILLDHIPISLTANYSIRKTYPVIVNANFVTNGCQIFLTADAGSIGITAPEIQITRLHGGTSF